MKVLMKADSGRGGAGASPDEVGTGTRGMRGWQCATISLLFSMVAFVTQGLYGSWHWEFMQLRRAGLGDTSWLSWPLIQNMHLAAMGLAFCSFIFAILAIVRGPVWVGTIAFAISLWVGWFASLIT